MHGTAVLFTGKIGVLSLKKMLLHRRSLRE
jgi:hypothetical protein